MGTVGQMFSTIQKVEMNGFTGGLADGGMVLLFIAMQILIMGIMICVSVFKPFGKKKQRYKGQGMNNGCRYTSR